jgi:ABC-type glutathione transport system ATPase component
MGAELVLTDVSIRYKRHGHRDVQAVDHLDLRVAPGEVVGLVGESGCGKSTLARAICGLERFQTGTATFGGTPIVPLSLRRRPASLLPIQMVFQNPNASLNPRRPIGSQLEDARAANPVDARSVADLLSEVEIDPAAAALYPHQFSGGQRQRIAIARAMAVGPQLLIGDEPIASLDASLQAKVARLARDVALRSHTSVLFISHDLSIVRLVADRIAVMKTGRIVEEGPTEDVWNQPQNDYTRRLLAAIPVADGLGRLPG